MRTSGLIAGYGDTPTGTVDTVVMDSSFFQTPNSVTGFYVVGIDLSAILPQAKFSPYWEVVNFANGNLKQVPKQLSTLRNLQNL